MRFVIITSYAHYLSLEINNHKMNISEDTTNSPKVQILKSPSKGKKDINNNTAFYRQLKNTYDVKKFKKYPKYFSLPPYFYSHGITENMMAMKQNETVTNETKNDISLTKPPKITNITQETFKKNSGVFCGCTKTKKSCS